MFPKLPGTVCELNSQFESYELYFLNNKAGFFDTDDTTVADFKEFRNGEYVFESQAKNDPFEIFVIFPQKIDETTKFEARLVFPYDLNNVPEEDEIIGDNQGSLEFTCSLAGDIF